MIENQHTIKCWARLSTNCCTLFWHSSLRTCILIKSSIGLDSRPRTVVCNKKCCQLNIFVKTTNKKNIIICFACEMKKTESSVSVVTKSWTRRFWLSIPDCDHRVKHADVTCWMYYAHTASETYNYLKVLSNCHVILT
jgi:hypothetical protein